jgi:hypothetical protein
MSTLRAMVHTHPGGVLMPARPQDRTRNLIFLGTLVAWMLYTRFYFVLHGAHATLPACPLYALTGHPCPFCGGTRGFAYTWNGDLGHAMQLYPLAPLLFVGTAIAIPVLVVAILAGRDIRIPMPLFKVVLATGVLALAISWGLKLTVLPN